MEAQPTQRPTASRRQSSLDSHLRYLPHAVMLAASYRPSNTKPSLWQLVKAGTKHGLVAGSKIGALRSLATFYEEILPLHGLKVSAFLILTQESLITRNYSQKGNSKMYSFTRARLAFILLFLDFRTCNKTETNTLDHILQNWAYWLLQSEYTLIEFAHSLHFGKYVTNSIGEGIFALFRTVLENICIVRPYCTTPNY